MNIRSLLPAGGVLALALLSTPAAVHAETITVNVAALVSDGCLFDSLASSSAASVYLGIVRPTGTSSVVAPPLSLRYRCTTGSPYRISFASSSGSLDITGNGSSQRTMSAAQLPSGTSTTSGTSGRLPYTLTWTVPSQFTGEGIEPGTPTHEVSLSAAVAAGAASGLPPGLYTDSLTVTISPQ